MEAMELKMQVEGNRQFTVPNGLGDIMQVCKKTFLHIFAITRRRIETLVKHKKREQAYLRGVLRKQKYT